MTEENSLECPNCGEETIVKPRVYYGVFRKTRQPDGVCGSCGAFYWKRPEKANLQVVLKLAEQKKEQEPEKWNWFKAFLEQEKEKKQKRRTPS